MSLDIYLTFQVDVGGPEPELFYLYSGNITHNLNHMAEKAGIYECMWRPDELGITQAKELIDRLTIGLDKLKSNPEQFYPFNPSNGWGDYSGLVRFVEEYLAACKKYPNATINVSR